jgi:hypothetical protein
MTTLPAPILLHPTEIEVPEQPAQAGVANGTVSPSKPRILPQERRKATTSSLFMAFTKPFTLDLENLYSRDTNELIAPYLEGGLALATVAQRVRGYFKHGEAKSQGSIGLLTRKCVAGLSKVWIGKESHPLADVEDLPDDETLEHYRTDTIVTSELSCNGGLVKQAGVERVAKAAGVDHSVLSNAVNLGSNLPPDALARIAKAIDVLPDGSLDVIDVPVSRQETIEERVSRLLSKGGRLHELAKFIHSDLVLKHQDEMKKLVELRKPPVLEVGARVGTKTFGKAEILSIDESKIRVKLVNGTQKVLIRSSLINPAIAKTENSKRPNYDLILRDVSRAADGGGEISAGLTADQIYVFAKKSKDKSTRGFIDFIFKQTKGTIPKNDIRYAIKHGGLVRIPTVIKP